MKIEKYKKDREIQLTGEITLLWNKSLGKNLIELDLSNNQLRGTIPPEVYQHHWSSLNLEYNKFNGDVSPNINIAANGSIKLQNNRLSGNIPTPLFNRTLSSVSILQGNIFSCSCSWYACNLPKIDSNENNYICGSDSTNQSFLFFLGYLCPNVLFHICWNENNAKGVDY